MASQHLILTLLPNERTAHRTLRVSAYLTPRLEAGAVLADFPDMLHWPARIAASGLSIRLTSGANTVTADIDRSVLRPDVWQAIFNVGTYVDQVKLPDYEKRLIVSYPVRDAHDFLVAAYQTVGTRGAGGERGLYDLLLPLAFRDGPISTLDRELAQMRVTMWNEQHSASGLAVPPQLMTLSSSARIHDMATRLALFHHMPPAPHRPPLPSGPGGFAKTLDFHKALTALNSYPSLLRALGLVFDLEVPASLCSPSPIAGAYRTLAVSGVTAGFSWSIPPTFTFPSTAYVATSARFHAAPATSPADLAAGKNAPGDTIDGLLAVTPGDFTVFQLDLDGAMLKALTLADAAAFRPALPALGDALSSLRSAGVSLAASGRALQLLQAISDNVAFNQAMASGKAMPRPFNARDLVRGYRIDIWSSLTRSWHSLHQRSATYTFGGGDPVVQIADEEGFTQLAAAQPAEDPTRPKDPVATAAKIPQPGTDLYLHERVAKWEGWSLSVARPGLALNRSTDSHVALQHDPTANAPMTPFKMTASFKVAPKSLPELRFGACYRLRARAVDLAGNSVALNVPTPDGLAWPAGGTVMPYLRFEPVLHPIVVPRQPPANGASLERLVIRSYNSSIELDVTPTAETDERHIAPPRIAVRLAEAHGVLDDAQGRLKGDAATYTMIATRDAYDLPNQGGIAIVSDPTLDVGYLPDPLARGAAFRSLPGTVADQEGRIVNSLLTYATLPDAQPLSDSVTYIGFGSQWPGRQSFRILMLEGDGVPGWDAANRVLSIGAPKASLTQTPLSSYMLPDDLTLMGVWDWLRQAFEAQQLAAAASSQAESIVNFGADTAALITRLALEGGHEMLTPARTLTLVHAVQQPLGQPTFEQLPVVHEPSGPILASALRNHFTPITAWRARSAHDAILLGGLGIHGASSAKIDLQAEWVEVADDLTEPAPVKSLTRDHVDTIDLSDLSGGAIPADGMQSRYVAVYIPQVDTLWFAAPFDELAGVTTPSMIAAPLHRFQDTKHRWISYQAVATSRFREYFPEPGLDFTRSGPRLLVDVPSSARPSIPDVLYVVPTFGWERQETSNVKTSVRFGNGLRVYLDRPWFSSGENELLGVVLWPVSGPAATADDFVSLRPYFTQWGNDPIWQSGALSATPTCYDFPLGATIGQGLTIDETNHIFDVAGHDLTYDTDRRLWFCDITFVPPSAYTPFIRLAVARYQPHSIEGMELSHVVLADFVQIAPNRTALLSINPADQRKARLVVGGLGPRQPTTSKFEVVVQQRNPLVQSDLGWELAASGTVVVTADTPTVTDPDAVLWAGTVAFRNVPSPGRFRVVVAEYEVFQTDPPDMGPGTTNSYRLVYSCILPFDFPETKPN
jgi:hypothetical protein